jgi:hypothetical protein
MSVRIVSDKTREATFLLVGGYTLTIPEDCFPVWAHGDDRQVAFKLNEMTDLRVTVKSVTQTTVG